jgi:DNA-binding SARP family transcriptional activator/tetratricopeptide (TPR) repeat protein
LEFHILGPLEIRRDGEVVRVAAGRQRALVAALLLHTNHVVPADRLIGYLWGENAPATALSTLQSLVHRLRRVLEPGGREWRTLLAKPPGYLLRVEHGHLDLQRFEELSERGRQALSRGDADGGARTLREALALWRGPALADVDADTAYRLASSRLQEQHLQAVQSRVEADLLLGRHADLIPELRGLVAEHPLCERLHGQLMVALWRAGRQANALETYRALRHTLVEQLGIEPEPRLGELYQAILCSGEVGDPPAEPLAGAGAKPAHPGTQRVLHQPAPAQLPAAVTDFVGRSAYLSSLRRLVSDAPRSGVVVAVVTGVGGVGKTALALRWAHEVAGSYPDGQLYADVRGFASTPPLGAVDVLARFLRALGVPPDRVPVDVAEAAATYRTLLAGRRMLVILDNAASADQVTPLLPGTPGCLVVVTSRDRLTGLAARHGDYRLDLDVFSPEEARELLTAILGGARLAAEPDAADELARACGYLPLALRIAAANLLNRPAVGIAAWVAELTAGDRLRALAADGDEHTGVRHTFDLSYQTLDEPARRLFRLLGLVPGPDFGYSAAAALAERAPATVAELLRTLAAAHLVKETRPGRFHLHDLLRLYASDLAKDEPERAAALARLLGWYSRGVDAVARQLYPQMPQLPAPPATSSVPVGVADQDQAHAWMEAERPNLAAAVRHCADNGPFRYGWWLAQALRGYFDLCRDTVTWLAVADAGLAAARLDGERRAIAAAELNLGHADFCLGRFTAAVDRMERALALARSAGWAEGEAIMLGNLGALRRESGQTGAAARSLRAALALNRELERPAGEGNSLDNLGEMYWQCGRLRQAGASYRDAIRAYRQVPCHSGEAHARVGLGLVEHANGRSETAEQSLTQALTLYRQVGNKAGEAYALDALAVVHSDRGILGRARDEVDTALRLARDAADPRTEAAALTTFGAVAHQLGWGLRASAACRRSVELARMLRAPHLEATALIGLASVETDRAGADAALAHLDAALQISRRRGFRVLAAHAHLLAAETCLHADRPAVAAGHAWQAWEAYRQAGHRRGKCRVEVLLRRVPMNA